MLKRFLSAVVFAGVVSVPLQAEAKVSIARAQRICEAAAAVLRPPPKAVQIDKDEMRTTSESIVIYLKVRTADDILVKVSCTVDRETSMATLLPFNLASASTLPAEE